MDDAFPIDKTQWADADGDGWGDARWPFPDAFPANPSQWSDLDGDGWETMFMNRLMHP